MKSKFRRYIDETLSEGHGKQLLWLLILIVLVVFLFWCILTFVFRDSEMGWQEMLALFLDPGCFGGAGEHDIYRLFATFLGMFLFSALLISIVSNIFVNLAESFKYGHSRYNHEDHVLIIGGGNRLFGMLLALCDHDSRYKTNDIVVVTTQNVDDLRKKIFSIFDEEKGRGLKKRLTIYYGDRDNLNTFLGKGLAKKSKVIYIIGEENEIDHDSLSLKCCRKLENLCHDNDHDIQCYMVLNDYNSVDIYKYAQKDEKSKASRLLVDIVDANEYIAEQVLVADHDGIDVVYYPRIDYVKVESEPGKTEQISGIKSDSETYVHLVIAGMTNMAKAMALTAAHICHFPNFKDGKNRTKITFVDSDMSSKMDDFVSCHNNVFCLSHYSYIRPYPDGQKEKREYAPQPEYGDFLDIEWQFIDSSLSSPYMRNLLVKWASDQHQSLSIAVCAETQETNTFYALHLPLELYSLQTPIFVYQQEHGDLLMKAKESNHFGNIHSFGMSHKKQDDPLFYHRADMGKRVNFVYDQNYGVKSKSPDEAWAGIKEADKLSSIYCGDAIHFKLNTYGKEKFINHSLTESEKASLYEVEHRRWMMSVLLLGYSAVDSESRKNWLELYNTDKDAANKERKLNKARFRHYDIMPFNDLPLDERDKDQIIVDNIPYILNEGDLIIQ